MLGDFEELFAKVVVPDNEKGGHHLPEDKDIPNFEHYRVKDHDDTSRPVTGRII